MTTLRCARCKRPLSTATVIHASLIVGPTCARIMGIATPKTIWSHCRHGAAGKGKAIKAVDVAGAYACTACDAAYDQMQGVKQAGLTREQVDLDWFHGHMRSLVILVKKGLVK